MLPTAPPRLGQIVAATPARRLPIKREEREFTQKIRKAR
jgi:hypothetical protein